MRLQGGIVSRCRSLVLEDGGKKGATLALAWVPACFEITGAVSLRESKWSVYLDRMCFVCKCSLSLSLWVSDKSKVRAEGSGAIKLLD